MKFTKTSLRNVAKRESRDKARRTRTTRLRRVNKSELRYRIMENTMRGYFRYSI